MHPHIFGPIVMYATAGDICGRGLSSCVAARGDGRRSGGQQGRRGQSGGALTARAAPRSHAPTRRARRRTARRRAPPAAGDAPPSPPRSLLWRTGSRRNSLPAGCKQADSRPVSRPTASSYKYQHRPAWARRLRAGGHDTTAVSCAWGVGREGVGRKGVGWGEGCAPEELEGWR
eukprot:COSAG01_NODE_2324_length_7907_cov_69.755763_8_plen_174_part_00